MINTKNFISFFVSCLLLSHSLVLSQPALAASAPFELSDIKDFQLSAIEKDAKVFVEIVQQAYFILRRSIPSATYENLFLLTLAYDSPSPRQFYNSINGGLFFQYLRGFINALYILLSHIGIHPTTYKQIVQIGQIGQIRQIKRRDAEQVWQTLESEILTVISNLQAQEAVVEAYSQMVAQKIAIKYSNPDPQIRSQYIESFNEVLGKYEFMQWVMSTIFKDFQEPWIAMHHWTAMHHLASFMSDIALCLRNLSGNFRNITQFNSQLGHLNPLP